MKVPTWLKDTRIRGVLAAAGVLLVVVLYSLSNHQQSASTPSSNLTLAQQTSQIAAPSSTQATSTNATSTKSVASTTKATPQKVTSLDAAVVTALVPSTPAQDLTASGGRLLGSIVNIVCVSGVSSIPSISGSGVIIDSRGIILTAAHVAQFFLLQDYLGQDKVECLIRTGSPARRAYFAEPIFVSPSWVANNPTTFVTASPTGTGENDFALLGITATATSTPLPSSFPFIPLAPDDLQSQQKVAIGSYGAQYLDSSQLNYSLYPILVFGAIQSRYTFHSNTVDLVSVAGSAASQEGSSGGGISDADGKLSGIITTSSVSGSFSSRTLNAITIGHIRRSYTADTGNSLDAVLASESVSQLITNFAVESKLLGQRLVSAI